MMVRILLISTLFLGSSALAQDEFKKNMYKGNLFTDEKDYEEAMYYFKQALEESPLNFKANFNVANTHFQLKEFDKAAELFSSISSLAPTGFEEAKVYHNLGNSFFMDQKLDEAIEAYKEALRLNPADEGTRYNLAYAQLLKKQQEEQEQDQNQNQNQNQDQDQNQDQNGGDSDQRNGEGDQNQNEDQDQNENQDQDGNNGDQNEEENEEKKNENQSNSDGNDSNQDPTKKNQSNSPSAISKEQARRILEAAYKKEKEVQEDLERRKVVGTGNKQKKDW